MLSRALILATVTLSIFGAAPDARAQNLEAGKSPSQLFASSCSVCHRSPRGLLKTIQPGALPGFLREHYTTSKDMAQQLSGFLLGNGATDPRGGGSRLTKQGEDAKSGRQSEPQPADAQPPGRRQRPGQPQEAAKPADAEGATQPDPRAARSKRGRRDQQQAAPGPDGQQVTPADEAPLTKRQKQKMGKKKGRDEPKPAAVETPAPVEAPKLESRPNATPAEMPKLPEPAPVVIDPKVDAPKPESRPDPVPQVTPAPSSPAPVTSAPQDTPAAAHSPAPTAAPSDAPPKPTISVTPPPPSPPSSGPAVAPISQ